MIKLFKYLSILSISILISACSPVKVKPISTYTIGNYQQKSPARRARTRLTLLVTTPIADPGYQTDNIIYIKTPFKLQHFSTHRWVAPPAEMILPILTQALRNRHYFYAIVSSPFTGSSSYRLDTKLLALQQDFLSPKSRIRVVIQASLLNNTTNKIAASRLFKVAIPTTANNPYSGVMATAKAVNKIAQQIARFAQRAAR